MTKRRRKEMADPKGLFDGAFGGGFWSSPFLIFLILVLLVLGCGGCI
jgi:hypothetical protein